MSRAGARRSAASALLLAVAAAGCVAPTPSAPPRTIDSVQTGTHMPAGAARDGVQLMLKLRRGEPRVDEPGTLARLQRVAAAPLAVVREMSGGAFVVRALPRPGDDIDAVLRRLQADPSVEYAVPDQPVRIQPR